MSSNNFVVTVSDTTNVATSVSVDATFWVGQNLIRRAAVKTANVWVGTDTEVRDLTVAAGTTNIPTQKTVNFQSPTGVVAVVTSSAISATVTVNNVASVLPIQSLMVLDSGVTSILFSNTTNVPVQIQIVSIL